MNDTVHTHMTVANVFARSATELDRCARIMRHIETRLLPVVVHAVSKQEGQLANDALQDIDLLVQTLDDMAIFLNDLAVTEGADLVLQAQFPLSRMRLFDLRQRIAGAEVVNTDSSVRISIF